MTDAEPTSPTLTVKLVDATRKLECAVTFRPPDDETGFLAKANASLGAVIESYTELDIDGVECSIPLNRQAFLRSATLTGRDVWFEVRGGMSRLPARVQVVLSPA